MAVPDDPSDQIKVVRDAPVGPQIPSLVIDGARLTCVRPKIGADPAGFFPQADMMGPAIFVALDPSNLTATPEVGDEIRLGDLGTPGIVNSPCVRAGAGVNIEAGRIDGGGSTDAGLMLPTDSGLPLPIDSGVTPLGAGPSIDAGATLGDGGV